MTPRSKTRLMLWLVVLCVFVLGGVTGASLDSAYRLKAGGPPCREQRGGGGRGGHDDVFEHMRRDLDLSDEQAAQIRAILEQTRNEYRALRAEARPRYDRIRQSARERIRTLLTPQQRERFDAKVAERDARRRDDEDDR